MGDRQESANELTSLNLRAGPHLATTETRPAPSRKVNATDAADYEAAREEVRALGLRGVEITSALVTLDDGHGLPSKDAPILGAAVASHCEVLLTGDIADFGHRIGRALQGVRMPALSLSDAA